MRQTRTFKSDLLLLLTAAIWGLAFVAQRIGMIYVGPFIFNAVRFALGAAALAPLALRARMKGASASGRVTFLGILSAGLFLFFGASLQQVGVTYTTAGKAGFVTGLYVVIVPFIGVLLSHRISLGNWAGAALAAVGLYFLTITDSLTIEKGDLYVLLSAFFWAGHLHIIGWLSPQMDSSRIAMTQFAIVSILSFIAAVMIETFSARDILDAAIPILYGGLLSVGIAYTLQVVAQREAPATHAAIILSLEAVFAVLGGWLILAEKLSWRSLFGCALMLAGMLISQLARRTRRAPKI